MLSAVAAESVDVTDDEESVDEAFIVEVAVLLALTTVLVTVVVEKEVVVLLADFADIMQAKRATIVARMIVNFIATF